jgi:LEA14-like dessication related protein
MFLPLVLLGGFAYLVYQSANELTEKISFSPVGVSLKESTLKLKIDNPTNTTATIQRVSGSILANGVKIGTYSINDPFKIPANNSIVILVKIKLDALSVLNQVSSLLQIGKTPKISVSGKIKTSLASVDFENDLVDSKSLTK